MVPPRHRAIERKAVKEIDIHVGYDPKAQKGRVLTAVQRADAGVQAGERHVTFESWEGLARTLTGERLALLKHLHAFPAANVAELSRSIGREYEQVQEDVKILVSRFDSAFRSRKDTDRLR
jgi:predicted transcriptional regulator